MNPDTMSAAQSPMPGLRVADNLSWGQYAARAERLYREQKAELDALLLGLQIDPTGVGRRQQAGSLLHMIAGTAAYFDEERLGDLARALEFPITGLADPTTIPALCQRLREVIQDDA